MASELDLERPFVGNPYPQPASSLPAGTRAEGPPADNASTSSFGVPAASTEPSFSAKPKPIFRVLREDDGKHKIFMLDSDANETQLGVVNVDGAEDILNSAGRYDPQGQTWDVPENVARSLMQGRLGYPDYLIAKFKAGEAGVVRSLIGQKFLLGQTDRENAIEHGHIELLKDQTGEAPETAWNGGFGKLVAEIARFATGEAAQLGPNLLGAAGEAGRGATVVGGGAMATMGASGLLFTPAGIALAGEFMSIGAGYGAFEYSVKAEAGSTAMDMLDKGFDDKTVKQLAPLAGIVKGSLEAVGFRFMTAPLKRAVLRNFLASDAMKKVLVNGYLQYAKQIGAEVVTEVAQERVDQIVNDMAANAEAKPELLLKPGEAVDKLWDVAVRTFAGTLVIGAPGAALDIAGTRAVTSAEKKSAAETTAKIEARQKIKEAAPQPAVSAETVPGPQTAPSPVPAETVPGPQTVTPPVPTPAPAVRALETISAKVSDVLERYQKGEATAEELIIGTNQLLEKAQAPMPAATVEKKPVAGRAFEQKARDVQTQARISALESDLKEVQTFTDDLIAIRQTYQKKGAPVRVLDERLNALLAQEESLTDEIEFYQSAPPAQVGVGPGEALEMKPATLESIISAGFVEGLGQGKRESRVRAQTIKDVAAENELSDADVRSLLKNKNLGLMDEAEFGDYVEQFRRGTARVVERKAALGEVEVVRAEKNLAREQNVRLLHKLPAISKMTTEQLQDYAKILSEYDENDEALTPKRMRALKTTPFAGAKTFGDVRQAAARVTGRPLEDFKNVEIGEFDVNRFDYALSRQGAVKNFLVLRTKLAQEKGHELEQNFNKQLDELAAAAIASRRKLMGVGGKLLDILVPQQTRVMAFIEEQNSEKAARIGATLTKEELALAEFLREWGQGAYDYLLKTGELETSRFAGHYVFHTGRPLSEMLRDLPDQGVRATIKEIWGRLLGATMKVLPAETGKPGMMLGLRKFMTQTMFRSGELTPSKNVVLSAKRYARDFYTKLALDEAVPTIETLVMSVRAIDKSPEVAENTQALLGFVREYLNAKKGKAEWAVRKGGFAENIIRFSMTLASLKYIAGNYALQATAPIGEHIGAFMHLGNRKMALALQRKFTKKGRAIIEKYSSFVGEGPLAQLKQPARTLEANLSTVLFGAFQATRRAVMGDILLGQMTEKEFEAGEISAERLAGLKVAAGRWIDIHGSKSIRGSSVGGAMFTQFKGWVIPPLRTLLEDFGALGKAIGTLGKAPLTEEQAHEFLRLAEVTIAAMFVRGWLPEDDEDDTFLGRMIHYIRRETMTMFSVLDPRNFSNAGVAAELVFKLVRDLTLLVILEEYKTKEGLKGWEALKRDLTPAAAKMFRSKDED